MLSSALKCGVHLSGQVLIESWTIGVLATLVHRQTASSAAGLLYSPAVHARQ